VHLNSLWGRKEKRPSRFDPGLGAKLLAAAKVLEDLLDLCAIAPIDPKNQSQAAGLI
jgi:hypothetical protein